MACRINRTTEWGIRMLYESEEWQETAFITCTYDNEHLPEGNSLNKEDCQKFIKRLRYNLDSRKIRYFLVGEYGEKTWRPHYHAIVFGLGANEADNRLVQDSWKLGNTYVLPYIGMATSNYVAGYIQKKLYGDEGKEVYGKRGILPPFSLMSQGIGKNMLKDKERILKKKHITVGGRMYGIPRYIRKKLGIKPEDFKDTILTDTDRILEFHWKRMTVDEQKKAYGSVLRRWQRTRKDIDYSSEDFGSAEFKKLLIQESLDMARKQSALETQRRLESVRKRSNEI